MMEDDITSFSNVISSTFENIKLKDFNESLSLYEEWNNILCRIKPMSENQNEGKNMAFHSRIIDFKNGILFIEADYPGWISLLQLHKKYIITGLKMKFPKTNFKNLVFCLKRSKEELNTERKSDEEIRLSIEKKLKEEDELNKKSKIDEPIFKTERKELPPKLKVIFEDLKKDIIK